MPDECPFYMKTWCITGKTCKKPCRELDVIENIKKKEVNKKYGRLG